MIASPAVIANAIALNQTGTINPFTVTSQPRIKRSNCATAISASKTTVIVVKGFKCCLRSLR